MSAVAAARTTRRELVRLGAGLALSPGLITGLAGCGEEGDRLVFSSWPEYIDQRGGR